MLKTGLKLFGVTLLLAGFFYLVSLFNPHWIASDLHLLIGVFFILTMLTTRINQWAIKQGNLVVVFIASQVIRIVFSLLIVYLFMSWQPAEANAVVGNFFIIYLFYLIFEIIEVLSNLRAELKRSE